MSGKVALRKTSFVLAVFGIFSPTALSFTAPKSAKHPIYSQPSSNSTTSSSAHNSRAATKQSVLHKNYHSTSQYAIKASSWKPSTQPRFDEFSSWTVGPWIQSSTSPTSLFSTDSPQSTPTENEIYNVEEVMRSCGGAVQGIREVPLSILFPAIEGKEDRIYHNRAHGGFVYADDGSYTSGPESWDWNYLNNEIDDDSKNMDDESTMPNLFMASLSFPGRRRVWLTSPVIEASKAASSPLYFKTMPQSKSLELARPVFSLKQDESSNNEHENLTDSISKGLQISKSDIQWKSFQRVRMPSLHQEWSLARAKWERKSSEIHDGGDAVSETKNFQKGVLTGWSFVERYSGDESSEYHNELFGDVVGSSAGRISVHMTAICAESKVARSVVRVYDSSGLLKAVAFCDGELIIDEK